MLLTLTPWPAGITWDGSGVRFAIATDHILYVVNVRPNYQFASCSNTLVYAFQSPTTREHHVMFWNTTTDEQQLKPSNAVLALAAHGLYTLLVVKGAYWGKFSLTICNSIGSPVDSRMLNFEPTMAAITKTHAIVCSADMVYVWHFCSLEVRGCTRLSRLLSCTVEPLVEFLCTVEQLVALLSSLLSCSPLTCAAGTVAHE